MKYYLAHPHASRQDVRNWELHLEAHLGMDIVNPFYDLDRDDIRAQDEGLRTPYEADATVVVERDKAAIMDCDGLIGIVDGSPSYGTIMEIGYAYDMGTPVFLIITNGMQNHYWLKYHSDKIYLSREEFEQDRLGE